MTEGNCVEIINIHGARAISLLFYDHQDTEYELLEIKIGVSGTIIIQNKATKDL